VQLGLIKVWDEVLGGEWFGKYTLSEIMLSCSTLAKDLKAIKNYYNRRIKNAV